MKFDPKKVRTLEKEPEIPLKALRKVTAKFNGKPDDLKLSFTFIMTAFFPTVYNNIMSYCKDCYMQGFMDGKESMKNEG